jgi:hypothetical protein
MTGEEGLFGCPAVVNTVLSPVCLHSSLALFWVTELGVHRRDLGL